jgi:hypothetical protein
MSKWKSRSLAFHRVHDSWSAAFCPARRNPSSASRSAVASTTRPIMLERVIRRIRRNSATAWRGSHGSGWSPR